MSLYTVLHDMFTGTAGNPLTGDPGSPVRSGSDSWTTYPSYPALVYKDGGGATTASLSSSVALSIYPLTGVSQDATYTFKLSSSSGGTTVGLVQVHRSDDGANDIGISVQFGTNNINLSQTTPSGTFNIGIGNFSYPLTTGVEYTGTVTISGTSLTLTMDDGTTSTPIGSGLTITSAPGTAMLIGQVNGSAGDVSFSEVKVEVAGVDSAAITGPTALTTGTASGSYTITLDTVVPAGGAGLTFTPSITGFSATPTPGSVNIVPGMDTGTFIINPSTTGTGTVSATMAGGSGTSITGQSGVVVTDPSTPAVSPTSASGNRGATQAMTASNFTGSTVTWSSDHTGRVTIDASTGVATYVGAGAAIITATGVADTSETATATLTGATVTLSIGPTSGSFAVGATHQIAPTVGGAVNTSVTYSSSDPSVATVSSSGLITGVTSGSATITVTSVADTSITATYAATITSGGTVSPSVDGTALSLVSGFPPGLVAGTTAGFGVKVAIDDGDYGALITDPAVVIAEEEPGAYSAFVTVPIGSLVRVKWYDGSGGIGVDANPQLPASSSAPWYADFPQCRGATSDTITLATTTGPEAKGQSVTILTGDGSDQARMIVDYDATSKVATIDQPWTVVPAEGDYYGLSDGYINLFQSLQDVDDPTVAGAMNAAHLTAFGKVILDRIAMLLKVYSHGSTTTPIKEFTYSDIPNDHTSRVPTS